MSTTAKKVEKTTLLSINPTIYFCGYGSRLVLILHASPSQRVVEAHITNDKHNAADALFPQNWGPATVTA
jgi:hypothetical protein